MGSTPRPVGFDYDQDALEAGLDLIRRSNAREIEFGYLDENVPIEEARWYAIAIYRGTKITAENHVGPVEAVEALARKLLHGARCRRCGKPIRLSDDEQGCRWRRVGAKWEPGCGLPIDFSIPAAPR